MPSAAHKVSLDLVSQRLVPSAMEPRSTIAEIDKKTGRLILHVQSQTPASTRDVLAEAVLKRPKDSVRVLVGDIGGGFGQKTNLYPEDGIVAYAATKLNRKIRWRGDRTDEFVGGTHGRDLTSTGEFALDAKGRVLAYRVRSIGGTGAYSSGAANIIPLVLGPFVQTGVYDLPLVHFEVKSVMTNTAPVGAYRGAGRPEAVFIVERLMDAAARQIGMDPRTIRKVNYIKPAQLPYTNAVGQVYDSGAFAHMLSRASELADWDGFAARKKAAKKKGLLYGRGLTSYIEWTGGRAHTEKVSLHATAEGRIILHSGTMAMGQGLQTTYTQMVSDTLGIAMDKIDVVQGDTDLATGFGSVGSRSLFVGGTAVAVSTNDMINKAREKASNVLETSVEDIEYRDGWLTVVGTDKRISLFEIAKKEDGARLSVDSEGEVDGPSWPNGTHICEVEIDPETGVSKVVRYTTVDDVGIAVNPMLVTGQVHGGVAQGIGQALYEGVAYSEEGQLLTASYQDYCVPRADDIPPIAVTLDDSAPCRTNPLGAKGCGESGAIGGPPCVTNGVMDALERTRHQAAQHAADAGEGVAGDQGCEGGGDRQPPLQAQRRSGIAAKRPGAVTVSLVDSSIERSPHRAFARRCVPTLALQGRTKPRRSQPQHHLRHDLPLDLRRAAEDRVRPAVEIFRHHRQHLLRDSRRLVEPVERPHRLDIEAVIADHVDAEPRHRLADFADAQF